jgi:hypothetical protein
VWQKIQSVYSPVCLDEKSITCVARDRLIEKHSQNTPVPISLYTRFKPPEYK